MVLIVSLTFSSLLCINVKAAPSPLDFAKQAIWYIVRKLDQSFFSRNPQLVVKYNNVTSNTGDIEFNTGNIGASTKVQISLNKSNLSLDAFAQTSPLAIFQKISILLTTPNGQTDVINKSVTHNQYVSYSSKSPYGTYMLRFVENDKCKWDCYYRLYDFDRVLPPNYQSLDNVYTAMSADGTEIIYFKSSDDKIYILPSENRSVSSRTFSNELNINTYLSMDQLNNEFFDETLDTFVNDLKNYNVGDQVLFKDRITEIEYDSINNYTRLIFDSEYSPIEWRFNGDLTSQLNQGDILKLKFNVVKEYEANHIIFETLDYFDEASNSTLYPDISHYIITN